MPFLPMMHHRALKGLHDASYLVPIKTVDKLGRCFPPVVPV